MKSLHKIAFVILASGWLARTVAYGMAEERIGPESQDHPTIAQPGWFKGIIEPMKHPSRVYSIWVNGNENFYFKATPVEINELIDQFARVRLRDHDIWIKPGTNTIKSFKGDAFEYNVSLKMLDGIALFMTREREGVETLEPSLTIYVGNDASLLKQLKLPEQAIMHCEVAGADIKNMTNPSRKAWYGNVQFDDGTSAVDFETGVTTSITLWDDSSTNGIPLASVNREGYFKAVFSDEELDDLKNGNCWLTTTVGNFLAAPKKSDPKFPATLLALDRTAATPNKIMRPQNYYYGRILFDDDSAPMLNSKPWPGAEISVSFPYAGSSKIDSEGYFKVFLDPEQMTALQKRKPSKNIYTPTQEQGSSRANDVFPPNLLSPDKSKAGVVKIAKPAYLK